MCTRIRKSTLQKALALAHQFKETAPETPVILTVHELKRLARNAAELMTLSADFRLAASSSNSSPDRSPASTTPHGIGALPHPRVAPHPHARRLWAQRQHPADHDHGPQGPSSKIIGWWIMAG